MKHNLNLSKDTTKYCFIRKFMNYFNQMSIDIHSRNASVTVG